MRSAARWIGSTSHRAVEERRQRRVEFLAVRVDAVDEFLEIRKMGDFARLLNWLTISRAWHPTSAMRTRPAAHGAGRGCAVQGLHHRYAGNVVCSCQFVHQIGHLDGDQRRLFAFVAVAAAGALGGVFVLVDRQHAIGDRQRVVQRNPDRPSEQPSATCSVVAGIAADDATQRNDRGVATAGGQARGRRAVPSTGDADHVHRILGDAVGEEGFAGAGDQLLGDARVPAADDDRETRAFGGAQVAFEMRHAECSGLGGAL